MSPAQQPITRPLQRITLVVGIFLLIEFLDELVFGAGEAAWPLIRNDLQLSYAQIGLLLGLPKIIAALIEPGLGILGDVWKRRVLILGGGLCFALALLASGLAPNFWVLLFGSVLFSPSSGAFVSLSQASLMDTDPKRHEQLMARWTLAGSLGVVLGPLALGAALAVGLGWRGLYVVLAVLTLGLVWVVWQAKQIGAPVGAPAGAEDDRPDLLGGLRGAWRAMRQWRVLRWLVLLEFSDFMLDVLLGFLALYCVDVAGVNEWWAGAAVMVWSAFGLLSDALIIPLLERVPGLRYLRYSALVMLVLYPAFLLVPWFWLKLILLALMGLANAGWYAILKGQLYSELPGQSGTVIAIDAGFGLVSGTIPALLGWIATHYSLPLAMWLLILGPIALLFGLPRQLAGAHTAPSE